jgi:hypothetical protein
MIVIEGTIRVPDLEAARPVMAHTKTDHIAEWRSHWPALRISDRSLRLYEGEPEAI